MINTASASGTFMPNPGQANYGAAKAGIAALTQVAALELERYGVRANAIAPVARTRLTLATPGMGAMFAEEVPAGQFDAFAPENISPIVAYLAQEKCPMPAGAPPRPSRRAGRGNSSIWRTGCRISTDPASASAGAATGGRARL